MQYTIEEIIQEHSELVRKQVQSQIPRSDVDDVMQEIWIGVNRGLPRFAGNANLKTWIFRIAENKVADYYRNLYRRIEKGSMAVEANIAMIEASASLTDSLPSLSRLNLPEHYMAIIRQRFVLGMTYQEIADENNELYDTARSRGRRAIAYIRKENLIEL